MIKKKPSELFEGPNSSLAKSFGGCVEIKMKTKKSGEMEQYITQKKLSRLWDKISELTGPSNVWGRLPKEDWDIAHILFDLKVLKKNLSMKGK